MVSLLEKTITITLNREALIGVLSKVSSIVPARSPKPILQLVRLIADPDAGTHIEGTDLEVSIRHRLLGVQVDQRIDVMLPHGRVNSILRGAEDDTVTISLIDGADSSQAVRIAGRRWKFDLPTDDPAAFPSVPAFDTPHFHVAAAADLAKLIRRTIFATDVESTRYALGGCLIEAKDDGLSMVGTDGRRLAHQLVPAEAEGDGMGPWKPVIPVKALKLIEKTLDPKDPPVHIAVSCPKGPGEKREPNSLMVRTADAEIWTRLVEGRFPHYQDIFPKNFETEITMDAGALFDVASQSQNVTSEESRGVDYVFDGDLLKLSAHAADVGSGECDTSIVTVSGPKQLITFDSRYIVDAFKTIDRKAKIRIHLIDAKNAAVFHTDDGYRYVAMPLTRDR